MDVVVSGRHCEVSESFRETVIDKISRLEKHDQRLIRVEVKVVKQQSRKDPEMKVEITAKSRGPVVRAEAQADEKLAAFDLALDKMSAQMRRAAGRRHATKGSRGMESLRTRPLADPTPEPEVEESLERKTGPITVTGDGPLVVREKTHPASPITVDQALYEMELVGHDFYLFIDKESERPSVVYRRKGYDYGVISLDVS